MPGVRQIDNCVTLIRPPPPKLLPESLPRRIAMSDISRHHLQRHFLVLGSIEALVLLLCAYVGAWIYLGRFPEVAFLPSALVFTAVMLLATMSTDVYGARLREGLPGMTMRTLIAFFVVGALSLAIVFYVMPWLDMGSGFCCSPRVSLS